MLTVALVDDEALVRVGLRSILESDPGIKVIAEAEDGVGALQAVRRHHVDVLALDLNMPGMSGMALLKELQRTPGSPPALVLTSFAGDDQVYEALETGACGFVLKADSPAELIRAVRTVAEGRMAMSSPVLSRVVKGALSLRGTIVDAASRNRIASLSMREREVFLLLGEGLSNAEMAQRLMMSEGTMKSYVSRVLAKLKAANRTQGALLAARHTARSKEY